MQIVSALTSDTKQRFIISLEDGGIVRFYLYYYPSQYSWYFDFQYGDYICNGNKVVLSPNTIRHLRNRLPFGIGFLSGQQAEPFSLDDFATGRVIMTILNSEDVKEMETLYEEV